MKITIIGTGYVGLVSGACFSDFGHDVTCVDKDAGKIAALERGEMPIFEPGLSDLVERNVAGGRLRFTTELAEGVRDAPERLLAALPPMIAGLRELGYEFTTVGELLETAGAGGTR